MTFAQSLVAAIADDPAAIAQLRHLVAPGEAARREPWVDAATVARHLGYDLRPGQKPQVVYDLARRRDGALPSHKIGGRLLFKLSEVDAWVEAGGTYTPPRVRRRSER